MHTSNFNLFKSFDHYLDENGNNVWDFDYLNFNKNRIIGKLKKCFDRNCVEKLKGKKIFTNKINLPKTKKNQFYVNDLINCKVLNSNNELLGKIINIDNFGAGDLINIKNKIGKSFYIPMNDENITKVDIKKKIIIVNPLKGMLE